MLGTTRSGPPSRPQSVGPSNDEIIEILNMSAPRPRTIHNSGELGNLGRLVGLMAPSENLMSNVPNIVISGQTSKKSSSAGLIR